MSERRPVGRQPGAFRLDDPVVEAVREPEFEALEPDADAGRAIDSIAHPRRRGVRWGVVALLTGGGALAHPEP